MMNRKHDVGGGPQNGPAQLQVGLPYTRAVYHEPGYYESQPAAASPADFAQLHAAHAQFLAALVALADRVEEGSITLMDQRQALEEACLSADEIGKALAILVERADADSR